MIELLLTGTKEGAKKRKSRYGAGWLRCSFLSFYLYLL
jgi:hypothetical protein